MSTWTPERRAAMAQAMRERSKRPGFQEKKIAARWAAGKRRQEQELAAITSPPAMIALPNPDSVPPLAVLPDPVPETNSHAPAAEQPEAERKQHWTMDERRTVAVEIARLMRKQGMRHVPETRDRVGRSFLTDFVFTAQLLLPRERRRKTKSPAALGDIFWTLVEGALTTRADLAPPATSSPLPSHGQEVSEPPKAGGTATDPAAPSLEAAAPGSNGHVVLPAEDPLRDVPLDVLLRAALRRLMTVAEDAHGAHRRAVELGELTTMQAEDLSRLRKDYDQSQQRIAALETALKVWHKEEKKPRVAIVGCLGYQFEHIKHAAVAAGLEVDLRHYDQESNPTKLSADWAIVLKWGSHAWQGQVNSSIPAGQHIFLPGGVGMAVNQLKTWFQS